MRNAGQKRPGRLRVFMPKASAREFYQSNRPRLVNALLVLRKYSRVLDHRRAFADCFGANSVASALGSSTRRDPSAADRTYHGWSQRPLESGTFYFARKRNFLLCLDSRHRNHSEPAVIGTGRIARKDKIADIMNR